MVKDSEAMQLLVSTAIALVRDEPLRQMLTTNIGRLAVTDAADRIAKEILTLINGSVHAAH
jgi:hypothetical protein